MSEEKIGFLGEEALKRKERLQALKRKNEESKENKKHMDEILPKPKFRSYKPQDEYLKNNMLEDAKPGDVVTVVREQLDAASSDIIFGELDLTNLAPRKPDWDLKRNIAKKLEILERRTQKAIAEEVRTRLKKGKQNLAIYVDETNKK